MTPARSLPSPPPLHFQTSSPTTSVFLSPPSSLIFHPPTPTLPNPPCLPSPIILCTLTTSHPALLALATQTKQIHIFTLSNASQWEPVIEHTLSKRPTCISFASPATLVVADAVGDLHTLSTSPPANPRLLLGHFSCLTALALSPSAHQVATGDRDGKIRVSRFPDCYVIDAFLLAHKEFVTCIWWSKDGRFLVSAGGEGGVRIWKMGNAGGKCLGVLEVGKGFVTAIVAFRGGCLVAAEGGGGIFEVGWREDKVWGEKMEIEGIDGVGGLGVANAGGVWIGKIGGKGGVRIGENGHIEELVEGSGGAFEGGVSWMRGMRKKEMVEGWKGKKRRWGEFKGVDGKKEGVVAKITRVEKEGS